jgi:ubiquinol-cytochrome c reductase cytochrome b subunit
MWKKRGLFQILSNHLIDYPSPINVSYFWSIGSLVGLCLVIQIITGIFLAMHYTPHIDYAFASVEHIMRDVNNGWLLRYIHANGASMMFITLYTHMFKNLYYGSYVAPRHWLWISGVLIMLATMATGFIGYVLPWGQMSFWGATVITNLFSALPLVGNMIVILLWGGFSVDNATLNRFLSLHYLLPFIIAGLSLVHLVLLHVHGNNNPLGVESKTNSIPFFPYFYVKDLFSFFCLLVLFSFFVFFFPNALGHSDNYIPANPMVTPPHIVPEWYFLPFYAILRSIPDKLGGVLAMFGSILLLLVIPFIIPKLNIRSSLFRPIARKLFWCQVVNCVILGWIGQNVVEYPYIEVGQAATVFYFAYFLILLPGLVLLENKLLSTKVD